MSLRKFYSESWKFFDKIVFKFLTLILSLILVGLVLPCTITTFSPIYLFRLIVSKTAVYLKPSLGKILTTRSTNFCLDSFDSPECVTFVSMTLEGVFPLEALENLFRTKILVEKLPNGELRNLELKQYPVDFLGFKFWNNYDFCLSDHISYHQPSIGHPMSDSDLWNIRQDLLSKPFKRNQSPWELLIVHNYTPSDPKSPGAPGPLSVLFFRVHHSVADGYSILKFLVEGICRNPIPSTFAAPKLPRRNVLKTAMFSLLFPFRSVFELSETILLKAIRQSPWFVPLNRRTRPVHAMTNLISIGNIKSCKNYFGVSFTSVVLAACGSAMREIMVRKGLPIPDNMVCVCPFPMLGHPDKLRNFMTQGFIEISMKPDITPEMRVKMVHDSYENLKRSTAPYVNNLLALAIGGTFTFMAKTLSRALIPSVIISNFPAAMGSLDIEGYRGVDVFFACGLLEMPGLGFYMLSYDKALRVAVVADSSLLTKDEIAEFVNLIEKQFHLLETTAGV